MPATIGLYRILRELGRGGHGTVFLVEQETPVRRQVALKIINPGQDTHQVLARFGRERQALALLDHPSIVKVFDAGQSEDGRPYFVIEYVPGLPLAEYCATSRLDVPASLRLFLEVCAGVGHAHQKGLIHRDLSSRNVLVSASDGGAVPRIIDFGVVHSAGTGLGGESLRTLDSPAPGTPEYMSPEHLRSGGADVDTRADIYSLGVLLYELLTGMLPISSIQLREASPARRLEIVETIAPAPPSARHPRVPQDLDWITFKAMAKDREVRYPTAQALADDLRRHLRHEPVLARPPSARYRISRFVRRHRALVAGSVSTAAALVLGLAASLWFWVDAARAQTRSEAYIGRFQQLGDALVLKEVLAEVDLLWPELPAMIDRYEGWLARTAELCGRLSIHRRDLAPKSLAGSSGLSQASEAVLEAEREQLIRGLEDLADPEGGAIAQVRIRLGRARAAQRETLEEAAPAWDAAIRSISDPGECPPYRGLRIQPQPGVVPLGRDPVSGLWEYFHPRTGVRPVRDAQGRFRIAEETGLVFVLIPGTAGVEPYFLSKYEMTQAQWLRVTGENPSTYHSGKVESGITMTLCHPVEHVSQVLCTEVLRHLGLVLPTNDEWEHACRAGTTTRFHTGDTVASLLGSANIGDSGSIKHARTGMTPEPDFDDGYETHGPVGTYLPNAFGLHDMHGNVAEWTSDTVETVGSTPRVAMRGGCFYFEAEKARSDLRVLHSAGHQMSNIGVRPSSGVKD